MPQADVDSEMAYYGGKLYLWGGRNFDYSNDFRLYSYDFSTQKWSGMTTTNPPNDRILHGMVVYNDYLYCLPGWGGIVEYDERDIKRINLKTGSTVWETLQIDANSEAIASFPRDSYGYIITGSVVYFACGWRVDGILNNVVKLDISKTPLTYEKLSKKSINPSSRSNHSIFSVGSKLFMFAGNGRDSK